MISAGISKRTRKQVYRREGYRCALCDSTRYLQIHHIVPRGEGGPSTMQNMICLCSDCHALAHGVDLRGFGADQETAKQAIVEYMSELYATDLFTPDGCPWNPWNPDRLKGGSLV